ncbi:hypothetical protein [Phenylobacterium sp. SCN 70-31]|uniref:hypothetical protein n=1 Tax=Phenylobacterium sp. SCN 70-31 TaxID=1660129 RepID=UPI00086D2D7E|nr:hypothetical protein [Phenylobacterium sp. SCN 70-31]ODT88347.1 MAG: hypothetical protein ABS78_06935 [Phenylobacterium sp. SCN 70-31]
MSLLASASPALPFPETVAVRIAGRLGMTFFLNNLRIVCDGGDLLDGLILLAVGQANLGHLDRPHGPPASFAGYDDVLDPALLRPISVNALAASLGQPFETVRRRTAALRETGACAATDRGLVIPPERWMSDRRKAMAFAIGQQIQALAIGLQALGVLRTSMNVTTLGRPWVLTRLAADYCLRQLEAMSAHIPDPTVGVLLIHIIRVTTEHLDDTYTEFTETEDLVQDDLRRPASVATLASRAGIPGETVRRHVALLLARGWIARGPKGGYYLTREMLRAAPWPQARHDNIANLNRMFAALEASARGATRVAP